MKGWSQRQVVDLAKRRGLNVGLGALRFMEEGKTKHPDAAVLRNLATLYELDFEELAMKYFEANYDIDLIGHFVEQGLTPRERGSDVPASDVSVEDRRVEREGYERQIAETRKVAHRLIELLGESGVPKKDRQASKSAARVRRRDRKTG